MKVGTEKSLIPTFYTALFADVMKHIPERPMLNHDCSYILKRYANEGERFVTQTLPKLGKAAETSLITLQPLEPVMGFELYHGERLPKLLHSLFIEGWNGDGWPRYDIRDLRRTESCSFSYSLWIIRQVCLAFSKSKTSECLEDGSVTISRFLDRIREVPRITASSALLCKARSLIKTVVMEGDDLNPMLAQWEAIPFGRHGPGAVARRECGREKWSFNYIKGIDPQLYGWRTYQLGSEVPADSRVCIVPKDYKSGRIICIEPKEFQFAQQGLMDILYSLLQNHLLTRQAISFKDQSKNFLWSRDYSNATIDLKDASDRVSKDLCRIIFPRSFYRLMTRYRSRRVAHNGVTYPYHSMATMGSAVCFPLETLVFWSITRATLELGGYRLQCRVFGDDIICPKEAYDAVTDSLSSCGFVVNSSKSCNDSLIRESCGSYYWCGKDVRIVRFQHTAMNRLDAWIPFAQYAIAFNSNGFIETSRSILHLLEQLSPVPYGYLGFPDGPRNNESIRYNKALQRVEVKVPVSCGPRAAGALPGYTGLYAWIVGNDTHPSSRMALNRVKRKWISGYSSDTIA